MNTQELPDFAEISAEELRTYVRNLREMRGFWSRRLKIQKDALRETQTQYDAVSKVVTFAEQELRDREPEVGGTYIHEDGFKYQSLYGRKNWKYQILDTTVGIEEAPTDGYGMCYTVYCTEHNLGLRKGPFQCGTARGLGYAWEHWTKEHQHD